MKTLSPPHPAVSLAPQLYFQLVHTLTDLLPPPLDDSPDALRTRNLAAIAKVAALHPVNANETDLAAQCIAARAQAEDVLRLIRENRQDIALTMRLNAQYASMVRTSVSVEKLLMQVQAVRRKREAIEGAADQDERRRQAVEQCMLIVADPDTVRQQAASPGAAREEVTGAAREEVTGAAREEVTGAAREEAPQPARGAAPRPAPAEASHAAPGEAMRAAPKAAPVAEPAPHQNQRIAENVSENDLNSHELAFETWMREQLESQGPDETGLRKRVLEAMAEARLAAQEFLASDHESPGGTD